MAALHEIARKDTTKTPRTIFKLTDYSSEGDAAGSHTSNSPVNTLQSSQVYSKPKQFADLYTDSQPQPQKFVLLTEEENYNSGEQLERKEFVEVLGPMAQEEEDDGGHSQTIGRYYSCVYEHHLPVCRCVKCSNPIRDCPISIINHSPSSEVISYSTETNTQKSIIGDASCEGVSDPPLITSDTPSDIPLIINSTSSEQISENFLVTNGPSYQTVNPLSPIINSPCNGSLSIANAAIVACDFLRLMPKPLYDVETSIQKTDVLCFQFASSNHQLGPINRLFSSVSTDDDSIGAMHLNVFRQDSKAVLSTSICGSWPSCNSTPLSLYNVSCTQASNPSSCKTKIWQSLPSQISSTDLEDSLSNVYEYHKDSSDEVLKSVNMSVCGISQQLELSIHPSGLGNSLLSSPFYTSCIQATDHYSNDSLNPESTLKQPISQKELDSFSLAIAGDSFSSSFISAGYVYSSPCMEETAIVLECESNGAEQCLMESADCIGTFPHVIVPPFMVPTYYYGPHEV